MAGISNYTSTFHVDIVWLANLRSKTGAWCEISFITTSPSWWLICPLITLILQYKNGWPRVPVSWDNAYDIFAIFIVFIEICTILISSIWKTREKTVIYRINRPKYLFYSAQFVTNRAQYTNNNFWFLECRNALSHGAGKSNIQCCTLSKCQIIYFWRDKKCLLCVNTHYI